MEAREGTGDGRRVSAVGNITASSIKKNFINKMKAF